MDIHDAFSRHDTQALIEFDIPQDTRVRVDWWHQVVGLASVHIEMQRIGDIGGPNDPSPPVIGRGLNGYLDFLHEDGTDLIPVDHGRWRISTWSTHQAMGEQKFTHAFADSSHRLFFVARGDVNGDGVVDVTDLLMLLEQWGACDSPCAADVDGSGDVDVNDALQVLADWTG